MGPDRKIKDKLKKFFSNFIKEGGIGATLKLNNELIKFDINNGIMVNSSATKTRILSSIKEKFSEIDDLTQRDMDAWESALKINSIHSYRMYLNGFPNGLNKKKAESAIGNLEQGEMLEPVKSFFKTTYSGQNKAKRFILILLIAGAIGVAGYLIINPGKNNNFPILKDNGKTTDQKDIKKLSGIIKNDSKNEESQNIDSKGVMDKRGLKDPQKLLEEPDVKKKDLQFTAKTLIQKPDPQKKTLKDVDQKIIKKPVKKTTEKIKKPLKKPKIKEVAFFSLPKELIQDYQKRMHQIRIDNVSGVKRTQKQIRLVLNVKKDGSLIINSFKDDMLIITPLSKRGEIIQSIRNKINSIKLTAPLDKSNNPVLVINFPLVYEVVYYRGRITLNAEF